MGKFIRRDTRRRLDQFIANPNCHANVLSAVHDIPMDRVAAAIGVDATFGQSPFAIARGQIFERLLFENEAARLRKELVRARVLPSNAWGFVDLRFKKVGGPLASLDESKTEFEKLLRQWSTFSDEQRLGIPSIVAAPTLQIPGRAILPDGLFAVDVVTVHPALRPDRITVRIGEIKVYPDRGGFTDSGELSSTRAQAGIYLHAMQLAVREYGVQDTIGVARDGFLVLSHTGSNFPSIRAKEDLRFQADRASRAFERLREAAAQALPLDAAEGKEVPPDRLRVIQDAPKSYCDACLAFCELADHCHARALAGQEPAALGQEVSRLLGSIPLDRAEALLAGNDPKNDAEKDFCRRAAEAGVRKSA